MYHAQEFVLCLIGSGKPKKNFKKGMIWLYSCFRLGCIMKGRKNEEDEQI